MSLSRRCPACGESTLEFFTRKNLYRCTNRECGEDFASLPTELRETAVNRESDPSFVSVTPENPARATSATVAPFLSSVPSPTSITTGKEHDPNQRWTVWQDFGPFLDAIPDARLLLFELDKLAGARQPDEALAATIRLFVNGLGYHAIEVDETRRLAGRAEFRSLHLIAEHRGFEICFVELARRNIFGRFYEAVYRFHPRSLIISVEPNCRSIRFVYRPTGAPGGQYRTLRGPTASREPNDNLVVWCRRLSLLAPRFEDDDVALAERCYRALKINPEELAAEWHSAPLPAEGLLPGIPWETTVVRGFRSFLQLGVPPGERLHWGLQALLHNCFPIAIARGAAALDCRGYRVGARIHSSDEAEATGRSATRQIELDLVLNDGSTEKEFVLPCSIPEPNEFGIFVIEGVRYRLGLRYRDGDASGFPVALIEDILDDSDLEIESKQDTSAAAHPGAEGIENDAFEDDLTIETPVFVPENEAEHIGQPGSLQQSEQNERSADEEEATREVTFRGALGDALFTFTVGRRLAGLAYMLFRKPMLLVQSPSLLRSVLQAFVDDSGFMDLSTLGFRRFLLVTTNRFAPEDVLSTLVDDNAASGKLPSWGCPEASSDLPPGVLLPIASTRIGPAGKLCVPVDEGSRSVRLKVSVSNALDVNPRFRGQSNTPREWWIAPGLRDWAHLPPGELDNPAKIAAFGTVMRINFGAVIQWHEPSVWISRAARQRLAARVTCLACRVPEGPWSSKSPILLVRVGAYVKAGEPWLAIPPDLNPGNEVPTESAYVAIASEILGENSVPSPEAMFRVERVPPGQSGKVIEARLTNVRRPGQVVGYWFAFVRLKHVAEAEGCLTLACGKSIPIIGNLEEEDAPYTGDGEPVELLLGLPSPNSGNAIQLFDGQTGESFKAYSLRSELVWTPNPIKQHAVPADSHLRRRLRDGEGIPAGPFAAALSTIDRLFWSIREAVGHATASKIERDANAGVPPWWPRMVEVLTAAVIDIPPIDPLHWIGKQAERPTQLMDLPDPVALDWKALRSNFSCEEPSTTNSQPLFKPLIEWIDEQGRPVSMARAGERVGEGYSRPETVPISAVPVAYFKLIMPVLHPWRLPIAAALLGVTLDELDELLVQFGPVELQPEIENALQDPEQSVRRRLAIESDPVRRNHIEACAAALRDELAVPNLHSRLWLDAVPLPSPTLLARGLPPGTTDLLGSALDRAYRRVALASRQVATLASSGSQGIIRAAHAALQYAVTQVFGNPDTAPDNSQIDTLAAWVRRLWPLSRFPEHKSVIPGLQRLPERTRWNPPCAPMLPDAQGDPALPPRPLSAVTQEPYSRIAGTYTTVKNGLLSVRCPGFPNPLRRPSNQRWWIERHASHRLAHNHLPALVVIIGTFDRLGSHWTKACLPPDVTAVASTPGVGRLLLEVLAKAIAHPDSAPARLCAQFEAQIPRRLPNDPVRAWTTLSEIIAPAIPDFGREALLLRTVLSRLLGSFWQIEDSTGTTHWVWLPFESPRPDGGQRAIPPFHSAAWNSWPDFSAWANPVRYLMSASLQQQALTPSIAAAVGFEASVPESIEWPTMAVMLPVVPVPHCADDEQGSAPQVAATAADDNVITGVEEHQPVVVHEIDILRVPLRIWIDSAYCKASSV